MGTYTDLLKQEPVAKSATPHSGKSEVVGERVQKPTQKAALSRHKPREVSRTHSRKKLRQKSREFPSRDEIQEFSFRLRDEFRLKVQAEVPHQWQEELDEVARELKVRKLELYRFIFGEFLGKVKRKKVT